MCYAIRIMYSNTSLTQGHFLPKITVDRFTVNG